MAMDGCHKDVESFSSCSRNRMPLDSVNGPLTKPRGIRMCLNNWSVLVTSRYLTGKKIIQSESLHPSVSDDKSLLVWWF